MLLVVELGNSQTSFGVFKQDKLLHQWRARTDRYRTADEIWGLLAVWLDHAGLKDVAWEGLALCSVVPVADAAFESLAVDKLKTKLFRVHRGLELGFEMNVREPEQVGADRLANTAYAARCLKLPAVVVDCGTATKFEVLTKEKKYEGGGILPGLRLMMESLNQGTAKLPLVELKLPKSVLGKTTAEALQIGILLGHCEVIEAMLARIEKEIGPVASVVLTGGFAAAVAPGLSSRWQTIPNLTLESVAYLFRTHA